MFVLPEKDLKPIDEKCSVIDTIIDTIKIIKNKNNVRLIIKI